MSEQSEVKTIAVVAQQPIVALLKKYEKAIATIVPKHLTAEKMLRLVVNAMNRETKLLQCNPMTLINAVLTAAQMGLEIGPGSAYLLPFKTKKKNSKAPYDCTLVIDYRGKIGLALRSGKVVDVEPEIVYSKEKFRIWRGEDGLKRIEHEPLLYRTTPEGEHLPIDEKDRGVPIGAYVVTSLRDGPPKITFMSRIDIMKIKAKSPAADNGPWNSHGSTPSSDELEMWKKTVVHRAFKTMPSSAEDFDAMRRAQDIEDRVDIGATLDNVIDYAPEDETAGAIMPGGGDDDDTGVSNEQKTQMDRQAQEAREAADKKLADAPKETVPTKPTETEERKEPAGWPNRAAMLEDFAPLMRELGERESWKILGANSISEDAELAPDQQETIDAFEALRAAVAEKRKTAAPTFGNKGRTR